MRRSLVALALLGAVALAAAWALREPLPAEDAARRVALPAMAEAPAAPTVVASPALSSGLGHARPPDPEALREAPARQAAYDAEARPGEFVTPPNVSIAH